MRPRHLTVPTVPALPALLALFATSLLACGSDDGAGPAGTADTVVTDMELEPVDTLPGDTEPDEDGTDPDEDGTADADPDENGDDGTDDGADAKPVVDLPDSTPAELVVTDLIDGSGPAAAAGDTVVVDYVGVRSADGSEFDNSYDREIPFSVRLGEGRVIAGWDQGLVGVQVGMRRQLDIPADLAYGDNPPGGSVIEAGDALTFVVDVRAVIASVSADDAPDLDIPTSSGRTDLDIVDVVVGDGAELEPEQTAITHLMLLRGDDLEVLESTWEFDDPAQIVTVPGGAIDGLVDGLLGMRVGGLRIITMPPDLAFGPEGIPGAGLPGDVDVIIVAELVGVY